MSLIRILSKFIAIAFFFANILNVIGCKPIKIASIEEQKIHTFSCVNSQSNCEIISALGTFQVKFSGEMAQGKIKTELPFHIQLKFNGADDSYQLQTAASYMEGKVMFMGKIPVLFQVNSTNTLIAETLLASCSEEIMTWRLWFTADISTGDDIKQQSFFIDFESQRL